MKFNKKEVLLLLAALALGGCTAPSPNIYNWDTYQTTIYQYYQKDKSSPDEQIASLNKTIETSRAKGLNVPPGLHAHLGMLYSNTGHPDEAYAQFNAEKDLFPESAPFMDFLLNNKGKPKGKGSIK